MAKIECSLLDSTSAGIYCGGLSNRTMERKRVDGSGPPYVKLGKAVRYRVSDLDAWIQSRVVSSTSAAGHTLHAHSSDANFTSLPSKGERA